MNEVHVKSIVTLVKIYSGRIVTLMYVPHLRDPNNEFLGEFELPEGFRVVNCLAGFAIIDENRDMWKLYQNKDGSVCLFNRNESKALTQVKTGKESMNEILQFCT